MAMIKVDDKLRDRLKVVAERKGMTMATYLAVMVEVEDLESKLRNELLMLWSGSGKVVNEKEKALSFDEWYDLIYKCKDGKGMTFIAYYKDDSFEKPKYFKRKYYRRNIGDDYDKDTVEILEVYNDLDKPHRMSYYCQDTDGFIKNNFLKGKMFRSDFVEGRG